MMDQHHTVDSSAHLCEMRRAIMWRIVLDKQRLKSHGAHPRQDTRPAMSKKSFSKLSRETSENTEFCKSRFKHSTCELVSHGYLLLVGFKFRFRR
jgi:hypothetical protein